MFTSYSQARNLTITWGMLMSLSSSRSGSEGSLSISLGYQSWD